MKRLILISPFMVGVEGHIYNAARCLYVGAKSLGIDFCAVIPKKSRVQDKWAHKVFRVSPGRAFFTVKNLFLLISKLQGKRTETEDGVAIITRRVKNLNSLKKVCIACIDVLNIVYMNVAYYMDLRKTFATQTLDKNTMVWVEIPQKYFVVGFWFWLRGLKTKPSVVFNLQSPLNLTTRFIVKAFRRDVRFRCHESSWARMVSKKTGANIEIAIPAVEVDAIPSEKPPSIDGRKVIGFVGSFRLSRGVDAMIDVITRVLMDNELRGRCRFVVQCTPTIIDKPLERRIQELKNLAKLWPTCVELITEQPWTDTYFRLLNTMDIILVPYTLQYAMVASAILHDSALVGAISIVPYYVEPFSPIANNYSSYKTLTNDPKEFHEALRRLILNEEEFTAWAQSSRRVQNELRYISSPTKYVKDLFFSENT